MCRCKCCGATAAVFANRVPICLECAEAVRAALPPDYHILTIKMKGTIL
jgi:hypothetical protein